MIFSVAFLNELRSIRKSGGDIASRVQALYSKYKIENGSATARYIQKQLELDSLPEVVHLTSMITDFLSEKEKAAATLIIEAEVDESDESILT